MRKVDDLVDGVNGLAFATTTTDMEYAGDELMPRAGGLCDPLKFGFPPGNRGRNANGLAAITADNGTKSLGNCRGCHEVYSLEFPADTVEARGYRKCAGNVQLKIVEGSVEKSDRGHGELKHSKALAFINL
jgi:hypothetical protein